MLQVLKSISDFERIINIAKTESRPITLIGYVDEPYKALQPGDLFIYVGTTKNLTGWSKHVLYKIQLKLTSELLNTRLCKNQLYVLNEILVESAVTLSSTYSYGIVTIKLIDGLNDFGIAGFEIYDVILKATDYYLKLVGGKGGN